MTGIGMCIDRYTVRKFATDALHSGCCEHSQSGRHSAFGSNILSTSVLRRHDRMRAAVGEGEY